MKVGFGRVFDFAKNLIRANLEKLLGIAVKQTLAAAIYNYAVIVASLQIGGIRYALRGSTRQWAHKRQRKRQDKNGSLKSFLIHMSIPISGFREAISTLSSPHS
jgi:hypothetical protein